MNDKGIKIGALIHDGLLLEKSKLITDDLIIECENLIKKDYPSFNIKLIIKPLEPTIKELDNYDSDDEEETPYTILCNKILADTTSRN